MAQEDVELVKKSLGIFRMVQGPTGLTTPDFVWDMSGYAGWPGETQYVGPEEFTAFFSEWKQAYDEWDVEIRDIRDAGEGRVVSVLHQRGRLRGTDSWVDLEFGIVHTVRDGKIARAEIFAPPEGAIEAAGVRP